MLACVKCGCENADTARTCASCTWPFSIEGWRQTSFKIQRLTIDTGCVNAKRQDPDLNKLETWAAQGWLRIERASVLLKELRGEKRRNKAKEIDPHPGLFTLGVSMLGGGDVLAGPDIPATLKGILFPTVRNLTKRQENDIEHLRAHVQVGGDVFVTKNTSDFIKNGKQQQLARIGIWVFQPTELVSLLRRPHKRTIQYARLRNQKRGHSSFTRHDHAVCQ